MEKSDNLITFPQTKQCPVCEQAQVQTTIEKDTFTYGVGSDAVELTVTIPVMTCSDCGFSFTDQVAEQVEHETICQHLGVMTPKKLATIPKHYRLSLTKFSEITRIGEELFARWENGDTIQNGAYDNFL